MPRNGPWQACYSERMSPIAAICLALGSIVAASYLPTLWAFRLDRENARLKLRLTRAESEVTRLSNKLVDVGSDWRDDRHKTQLWRPH